MQASRVVSFVAFCVAVAFAGKAVASAPALVMDVDSGKVLYAERATDPWYPASIKKLMTAYVALSAVRAGRGRPRLVAGDFGSSVRVATA